MDKERNMLLIYFTQKLFHVILQRDIFMVKE